MQHSLAHLVEALQISLTTLCEDKRQGEDTHEAQEEQQRHETAGVPLDPAATPFDRNIRRSDVKL